MKTYKLGQKQMQKQLLRVLSNTHDGFFALDRKWRYLFLNEVAERYSHKSKLLGKVIWEIFPDSKKTLFYKKYHEAMESGKMIEFEEHIDHKWFDIHVIPFDMGIWVFYRDITEHKLLDERKDEFIRMASHELKTPITSLKLYAELLRDLVTDSAAYEYIHNINHQADHLNKIITDMLDLSHIELGRLEFKKRDLDLVALLQEVIGNLQKSVPQRLETNFKIKTCVVHGDKIRLIQAFTNLINNAVKYSPGCDRIIITVQKDKKNVEVIIQDFGVGIDPAYQNQIFDRFFQASGTKGKVFPGMGIGLYLTKIIATKHKGEIKVTSDLGHGSTFTLSLPIHQQQTKQLA
jgi:signal transduction histidine kinase